MTKLIIIWFIFINFLSFILFYLDKKAAVQQLRRIPENVLHKIEYLGGWLGSLIAAEKFKHKRRKQSYQLPKWM